jgi:heat shock protein HspQ
MCKPKKRDANIKFAVGMIVEVRPQGFTGVIIEWEQKNLDRLDIPTSNIYTVLADNKLHYVSEGINKLYYVNYFMLSFLRI